MITFKPLTKSDFQRLQKWLNVDFVTNWYQRRKFIYDDVEKLFSGKRYYYVPVTSFIVEIDSVPIGYAQNYRLDDYPYFSSCLDVTESQAGMDVFIGDTLYLRKGYGAPIISQFVQQVVFKKHGIETCIVGIDPLDLWTIKVYKKAGFTLFKQTKEYFMMLPKSTEKIIFKS